MMQLVVTLPTLQKRPSRTGQRDIDNVSTSMIDKCRFKSTNKTNDRIFVIRAIHGCELFDRCWVRGIVKQKILQR